MTDQQDREALVDDALNFAQVLLVNRVMRHRPHWLDEEDARQDVCAFVLSRLDQYDASKAAVTSFVAALFDSWYKTYLTAHRWREEHIALFDPLPGYDDSESPSLAASMLLIEAPDTRPPHEMSELCDVLMSLIPEGHRLSVELHLGYGVSLSAVAELTGTPRTTVDYHVRKARKTWRDSWERAA